MALRRFQFHLSTAVLLMLTAGGMWGLNLRKNFIRLAVPHSEVFPRARIEYGFPVCAYMTEGTLVFSDVQEKVPKIALHTFIKRREAEDNVDASVIEGEGIFLVPKNAPGHYFPKGAAINCVTGLGLLILIGVMSEYYIRSRNKQN